MGIAVLPPDINASSVSFSVDGNAIRFGLAAVRNVGEAALRDLEQERDANGPFTSLMDFCSRIDMRTINKRVIESLIKCGAFDSLGVRRAQLLDVLAATVDAAAVAQKDRASGQMGLFDDDEINTVVEVHLRDIPEVDTNTMLTWEKEITGFYITGHPLDAYKQVMTGFADIGAVLAEKVQDGKTVRVGGMIVSAKRIATKKGDTMCFVTLEDYTNSIEVVVFPKVFYDSVNYLEPDSAVMISGKVNYTDEGIKILADRICPLAEYKQDYYLAINSTQENDAVFKAIKDVLQTHRGDHVVYIYYSAKKKLIKTDNTWWMDGSKEAVDLLKEILGDDAVKAK